MEVTVSARDGARRGRVLPPRARKTVLTVHVIASVAWIGASLCLLVLGLTGLLSGDPDVQRASYGALGTIVTVIAVPVSLAAFLSGIVVSVGSRWGLFRHWWVVISLVATAIMAAAVTFALAPMMRTVSAQALAAPAGRVVEAVGDEVVPVVVAPSVAVVALSLVTAINVFKPRGRVGGSPSS